MRQLQFDFSKGLVKEEKITYWKYEDDIPDYIREFAIKKADSYVLKDNNLQKLYCPLCTKELDKTFVCPNCQKHYKKANYLQVSIKEIKEFSFTNEYFAFDVVSNEVILYIIEAYVCYNHPSFPTPHRILELKPQSAYHILKDRMIELNSNKTFWYKDIDKNIKNERCVFNYELDYELDNIYYNCELYPDNLEILKDTIYSYTYIWLAKEYLKDRVMYLSDLTYLPIHFSAFEYLIKNQFYSFAFDNFHLLKYDNDTKLLLNPHKEYLNFMIKNNFNYNQFNALKLSKIMDMKVINFMQNTPEVYEAVFQIKKIDILKLINYLEANNKDIIEYYDYLKLANELGYNLKDKDVIFPHDLTKAHDEILTKKYLIFDHSYDRRIKKLSHDLAKNKYEDKEYVIYPASSVKDILAEGQMQNNCLRMYIEDYSHGKTQIYFMRQKADLKKSFVTIEIKKKKLIQAKMKNNVLPNDKIMKIINNWINNIVRHNNK